MGFYLDFVKLGNLSLFERELYCFKSAVSSALVPEKTLKSAGSLMPLQRT